MCSSSGMNRIFSDWLCAPHTRDTEQNRVKEAVRRLGGQAQTILGSHTHPLAFALPIGPPSLSPAFSIKTQSSPTLDLIFLWHGAPASFLVLPKAFRDFGRLPVHGGHQPLQHGPSVPPQQPAPPDLQPHHPVHLAPVPGRGAAGLLCGLPAEGPVPGDTHQWESGDDGAEWPLRQLHRESTLPGATEQAAGGGTEPAEREGAQPSGGHLPGGAEGAPQAGGWPQRW